MVDGSIYLLCMTCSFAGTDLHFFVAAKMTVLLCYYLTYIFLKNLQTYLTFPSQPKKPLCNLPPKT